MIRRAFVAVSVGVGLALTASPALAQTTTAPTTATSTTIAPKGCSAYTSQAAAQAALRANPVDPNGLDPDRNGIACETNDSPFDRTVVVRTATAAPVTAAPVAAAPVAGAATPTTALAATPTTLVTPNSAPPAFGRTGFSPTTLLLAIGLMLIGWRMRVAARPVARPGRYDVLPRDTLKRQLFG